MYIYEEGIVVIFANPNQYMMMLINNKWEGKRLRVILVELRMSLGINVVAIYGGVGNIINKEKL